MSVPGVVDPRLFLSMFIDEIKEPVITDDPWQTAADYSPTSNCFDTLEMVLDI